MKTNRPDISHIRKYLDGELDAHAMYELERQAQGDPLLMDLLTGMESADKEVHEANLSSIDRQIRERVEQEQKKRAVSWRTLAVAVSVLWGVAFVGLWLLQEPREKQLIVQGQKTVSLPEKVDTSVVKVDSPLAMAELEKPTKAMRKPVAKAKKLESTPSLIASIQPEDTAASTSHQLDEVVIVGFQTQSKRNFSAASSVATVKPDTMGDLLAGRVAGMDIDRRNDNVRIRGMSSLTKTVDGTITDMETGQPLVGVAIRLKASKLSTLTDEEGHFSLSLPLPIDTLDLAMVGYERVAVQVQGNQEVDVELAPTHAELSEVVVVGYGKAKTKQKAQPLIGWKAYRHYLKENAISAQGKGGQVVLAFQIDDQGRPKAIRIEKGASEELNQQAKQLLLDGSKWIREDDHPEKEIQLKVRFK